MTTTGVDRLALARVVLDTWAHYGSNRVKSQLCPIAHAVADQLSPFESHSSVVILLKQYPLDIREHLFVWYRKHGANLVDDASESDGLRDARRQIEAQIADWFDEFGAIRMTKD